MPSEVHEMRDTQVIEQEESLYEKVREHLTKALVQATSALSYDGELVALRDQIADARMEDVAPLVEQMYRTAALAAQQGRAVAPPPDPQSPYFGRMVLKEGEKTREVLLGKRAFIDREAGVVIVDWRNAPVSRIFYRYEEGDNYEESIGDKLVEGDILTRSTLSIVAGMLRRITRLGNTYIRKIDGSWSLYGGAEAMLAGGQRTALRPEKQKRRDQRTGQRRGQQPRQLGVNEQGFVSPDKHLPEIAALIDPQQFDLITRDTDKVTILTGGAGSGKTTVALHRIAYLHFQDPHRFRPKRMVVIVPHPGLVEYVARVLPSLDVAGVDVRTFTSFARRVRRRMLPRLRWKTLDETPEQVALVKKHPAMLQVLQDYVAEQASTISNNLRQALEEQEHGRAVMQAYWNGASTPIAKRIAAARSMANRVGGRTRDSVVKILALAQRKMEDVVSDWANILTDKVRLNRAFSDHPKPPPQAAVVATVRHVLGQMVDPREFIESVDEERRIGADGVSEDDNMARRFDPCDEALLLRLWQLKHGQLSTEGQKSIAFDHVVIDEAQDFSALEVRILLDACRGSAMTLAGDMAQKVIFDNGYQSWEGMLKAVGTESAEVSTLALSYRSTYEVMQLARDVLGPLAPEKEPICTRAGAPVSLFRFAEAGETVAFLAESLRSLMGRERASNVAVLARFSAQADLVFQGLARAEVPRLRRVSSGDFSFAPGVDVTDVTNAKGLEYDYVILVDVDAQTYPATTECRHLLHVAVTRTVHQLWITCSNEPSSLLPKWLVEDVSF